MEALANRLARGDCEPFLREIRFPNLKNLAPGMCIEFEHPVTALVGPNGTNKTTILRALEGCPRDHDLGEHWFETSLDKVEPEPARYIHTYHAPSGCAAEVIKTRVARAGRHLDYFETRAPRIGDGMAKMPLPGNPQDAPVRNKTRWRPIDKPVLYLDFRHAIPAFDIHFLFDHHRRPSDAQSKKSLVRRRSKPLANAFSVASPEYSFYGRNRILDGPVSLTVSELDSVSRILGRKYDAVQLVRHDFFDVVGDTALIRTRDLEYSEAFAGSGEFAVMVLVHALASVPDGALVLLDEPETSLHPGAQQALMQHLAESALRKRLQIVFSTHSPTMVEGLSPESIRVLDVAADGKVHLLSNRATVREAFSRIGAVGAPASAIVEDELSRAIIERAARTRGLDALTMVDVQIVPGGASSILNVAVPTLAHAAARSMVVLDGDKAFSFPGRAAELSDADVAKALTGIGITHQPRDGGDGAQSARRAEQDRALYSWCVEGLAYLPKSDPESLLLAMLGEQVKPTSATAKAEWKARTRIELGKLDGEPVSAAEILETQRRALATVPDESALLQEVVALVERILAR